MTDEWVVKISRKDVDVDKLAHDYGFRNMGKVGTLKNYFMFKKLKTKNSINAPPLKTCDKIDFQERQIKRMRYKREIEIKDPLWPKQWHLRPGNNSLNTMPLWRQGIMGEGVTIAIVDDGLEKANFDVSKSYNAKGSYDFNSNDFDPTPRKFDGHGTAAAGCAAAPMNGICGVGVAPKAQVSGIRLIADETTDAQEAKALSYQTQVNHIFSNSWGPYDDGHRYEGPGPVLKEAIKQSIKEGRAGKGTIYVWASGNGRKQNDNCNYDGYASSKYTIAIGAITDIGRYAFYSEPCAALIACAPSSGGFNSISTCGNNGVNKPPYKDCNILFGGTSASSPLAAGAIALMLGVKPELTWRDVQHILVNTSTKVDSRDKDWWNNEGGFYHNHNYGFGLINPEKAVEMSRQWKTVGTYYSYKITVKRLSEIPQGSLMHVDFNPVSSKITFIEHVEVLVKIKHERKGPLLINLSNSFNTTSHLAIPHQDFSDFPEDGWTYTTVRHWGEKVNQKWTLTIGDTEGSKPDERGTFVSATLIFYGTI